MNTKLMPKKRSEVKLKNNYPQRTSPAGSNSKTELAFDTKSCEIRHERLTKYFGLGVKGISPSKYKKKNGDVRAPASPQGRQACAGRQWASSQQSLGSEAQCLVNLQDPRITQAQE